MTGRATAARAGWFPGAGSTRPRHGQPATGMATNGFLSSMLSATERVALREINVRLTDLAIGQWEAGGGVTNQIDFGTQIGTSLDEFAAHGVGPDELRRLSRDRDVVFPWSLLYGDVRTPFNRRLVRLPLLIAFPRTVEEVVGWVEFVRGHGFSVSVRSGNNSYEGLSSSNEVIVDLTFLTLGRDDDTQCEIDAQKMVVTVASGVRLGILYDELAKQGLALAGGQCAPVCVGGLVGTGGIGFLTRAYGWACDQLLEVEYVLASGDVVRANAHNEHADLYRASKGAGAAGFGIMTRLILQLVPARWALVYSMWFDDLAPGPAVVEAWQHLAETAPPALSSLVAATAAVPDVDAVDGPAGAPPTRTGLLSVHGEFRIEGDYKRDPRDEDIRKARDGLLSALKDGWLSRLPSPLNDPVVEDLTGLAAFEELLGRRRANREGRPLLFIGALPPMDAALAMALLVPMPFFSQWKLKSTFTFRPLPASAFTAMFDYLQHHAPSDDWSRAQGAFNPWLLGGRSNEIDPDSAAIPVRRDAVMWVAAGALWNDPSLESDGLAWVDGLWAALEPVVQSSAGPTRPLGTAFYGSPDLQLGSQLSPKPDTTYLHAYWSSPTHDFVPFLLDVKRRYDPDDVFRFSQSIPAPTR